MCHIKQLKAGKTRKTCLTNHTQSESHHIMSLIINTLVRKASFYAQEIKIVLSLDSVACTLYLHIQNNNTVVWEIFYSKNISWMLATHEN